MSKERLVDLIEKAKVLRSLDILSGDPDVIVDMPTEDEYIANYLLANGVIVPPCKVGDVLWIPSVNSNKVYSKVVKDILIREKDGEVGKYIYASSAYFPFENIGKSIFLTREEAEAKLKGRENE